MNPVLENIRAQPEQLRKLASRIEKDPALKELQTALVEQKSRGLLLTGMGASYLAAYAGCIYLQVHRVPAFILESSELLFYGLDAIPKDMPLVIISQSGVSIEVREILSNLKKGQEVWGITNDLESPLGRQAGRVLPIDVPSDHSIAVNTYTCALGLLLALFSACFSEQDLLRYLINKAANIINEGFETWKGMAESAIDFLDNPSSVTLLGYGPSVASAWEGALLFKEGAKLQADGLSGGQFRHGSIEIVDERFRCIVFAPSGRNEDKVVRLIDQILACKGKVIAITNRSLSPHPNLFTLGLPKLNEFVVPLFEIVPIQLLVYHLALRRGVEPGFFRNTAPVIRSF